MRDPFFVVTTGRSGSVSLALTLSQHPYVCALHEPWQYLIELSWKRLAGQVPGPGSAVGFFRQIVPRPAGVQVCGIVDQKLSAFIPDLAEAFPGRNRAADSGCAFVWLVRDGRCVVASGYERGWYQPGENPANPWSRWRWRGDEVGDMPGEEWERLSPFGRNCWYWSWVNGMIRRELGKVDLERWRMVKLEQLDGEALGRLQEWLGVVPVQGLEMARANRGPGLLRWETWSKEQRATFGEMCGEMMVSLGYEMG